MARTDSMSLTVTSPVRTRCSARCSTVPGIQLSVPPATRCVRASAAMFTNPALVSVLMSRAPKLASPPAVAATASIARHGPFEQRGMLGRVHVVRHRRGHDPTEVNGFQHQPAARADGRDHPLQRALAVRDVLQDGTRVRQVEGGLLQRVGQDVVLADVQVGPAVSVKETRVKIGGDDPAGAAHSLGQPQRDAARPESDLQAVPAVAHAQASQALLGVAVEQGFDPDQAIAFLLPALVKDVRVHARPSPARPRWAAPAIPQGSDQLAR